MNELDNPSIEAHNLTVIYHRKPVLWNIDFFLPQGQIIGIMGPNGAGKSTLIKAILGLVPLNSGYSRVYGQELKQVHKRVSYIPQRQTVDWDFPATVLDVVLMGRYQQRGMFSRITAEDRAIAKEALEQVNMVSYADRQISQLSGGQQQRVFLARALAQQADLYLLDEPFVGVDAATEQSIMDMLRRMRAAGKTIVVVHHDLHTAPEYFDWLVLLNASLIASGPLAEVFTDELLKVTYSGKLTVLSQVGDQLRERNFPVRES
ncbi:MAG TPA: metal ABC transporter ATP-binding protein [Flavobacteriales bacterium]|nr:metal ABC transporter ATP-binding protein [Flavobacteriales bacterium]